MEIFRWVYRSFMLANVVLATILMFIPDSIDRATLHFVVAILMCELE